MKIFRTLDLAVNFHKSVNALPITGHLKDQLFRASTSIPLNLSEGNAKSSVREKKRFYQTAYASVQECKTILKIAEYESTEIANQADKLGAWLYKLLNSEIQAKDFRD